MFFFPKEDNNEIENNKNFFSTNNGPISTKLSKKHPWVKGTQVFTNTRKLSVLKKEITVLLF